jgi:hypothetical protein
MQFLVCHGAAGVQLPVWVALVGCQVTYWGMMLYHMLFVVPHGVRGLIVFAAERADHGSGLGG